MAKPSHADALFDDVEGVSEVDPLTCPELWQTNIDVQGEAKHGKTTLLCGDPDLLLLKLAGDGSPIARKRLALVLSVLHLDAFERILDKVLERMAKTGEYEGRRCIAIDNLKVLEDWMSQGETAKWNVLAQADADSSKPDEYKKVFVEHISEIPKFGAYDKIATRLRQLTQDINGVGAGWRTVTHYKMSPVYKDGKPTTEKEWKPDVFPSVAAAVAKNADLLLMCGVRTNAKGVKEYVVDFSSEASDRIGSRLPLGIEGRTILPNYDRSSTDVGMTAWVGAVVPEFDKAVARYLKEQRAFQEAHNRSQID